MNLEKIKSKKPRWVPKFVWNAAVNSICDSAKANVTVDSIGTFAGDASMDGLQKLVADRDPQTVDMICTTVSGSGQICYQMGEAARDRVITDEERSGVGSAIGKMLSVLVPDDVIKRKIEEIRQALLFK